MVYFQGLPPVSILNTSLLSRNSLGKFQGRDGQARQEAYCWLWANATYLHPRKPTAPVPDTLEAILHGKPVYILSVSRKSPATDGRPEDEGVEYYRHFHSVLLNDFMDNFAIEDANVASVHFAATELGNSLPLNDTVIPAVLMRDRIQWEKPTLNISHI